MKLNIKTSIQYEDQLPGAEFPRNMALMHVRNVGIRLNTFPIFRGHLKQLVRAADGCTTMGFCPPPVQSRNGSPHSGGMPDLAASGGGVTGPVFAAARSRHRVV